MRTCMACGADPCRNPSFCAACREADRRRAGGEQPARNERRPTTQTTIEALMLGLRERGVAALNEPKVDGRLAELRDGQLLEVATRLQKLKPEIALAWNGDEIETLIRFREGQP